MPTKKTHRRAATRTAPRSIKRRTRLHTTANPAIVLALPHASPEVWRARRPKLVAAALVVGLVALLFAFFDTDQFYLFDIQVEGAEFLTAPEIERASGIIGYNIFFVEPQAVERAISRLPEVKAVHVSASVPNHLAIQVEERMPQVTWVRGAEMYWVDADGIAIKARGTLGDVPTVRDLDQAPVQVGQVVASQGLAAVQALRTVWPAAPHALEWSAARGLVFTDDHGWKIYLGDASEMAGKLAKYRALAAQLVAQKAQVKFIDLGKGDPYYQ